MIFIEQIEIETSCKLAAISLNCARPFSVQRLRHNRVQQRLWTGKHLVKKKKIRLYFCSAYNNKNNNM